MAAPSGTSWGSIAGGYGRIGIYYSMSSTSTTTSVSVEVWFWSKYSVSDSSNTYYFDNLASAGSATTSKGSVSINTTVASGEGWSTSNQQKLGSYSYSYTRGTSATTRYLRAKLINIDRVGATMTAATSFTVPKLASYTIKYNANGGSGTPSSQTKWYGKSLTLSSTKPTRTGYTFQGWATSTGGSVAYAAGASYTANASVTLYAVWKAVTYTVKYNANGGSGAPGNQTKTYGVSLTLSSTKPTRTNYTFKGWGTSASATTVSYAAGASYTKNAAITLYAVWELSYEKPKIKSFSVQRCGSDGTVNEAGTYALVKFSWSCSLSVSKITITWKSSTETTWSSTTVTASGTSGTVSKVIGANALSVEKAYTIGATVADSNDESSATRTLNGTQFPIDFLYGGGGTAIGKPAELDGVFDVGFLTRLRKHLMIGNKTGHLDGNTGVFISYEGYMQIQRDTSQGYHPYIGFLLDDSTDVAGVIRLNSSNGILEFQKAADYTFDSDTKTSGNSYVGDTSEWEDGKCGVRLSKSGGLQIQRTASSSPYIDFFFNGSSTYDSRIVHTLATKYMDFKGASAYQFDAGIITMRHLSFGRETYSTESGVNTLYKDGSTHWIMFRSNDGLTSNFGWSGSSSYSTITKLRGQTCQYANASGTTTLSDERLKKDFTDLEKWGAFFDSLEPCAFRMKTGVSGRFHLGFKAQQVKQALLDTGLTTQDFAGFVKMEYVVDEDDSPEEIATYNEAGINPGDEEYGLIYTEFIAMNTYEIQKLKKENGLLKEEINSLKARLDALEQLLINQT